MPDVHISHQLSSFFEAEYRNTRQAIAQGDLDIDHPLTLSTALDSLRQAPHDVVCHWLSSHEPRDAADPSEIDTMWAEVFETTLELASLLDSYGGDTPLATWLD